MEHVVQTILRGMLLKPLQLVCMSGSGRLTIGGRVEATLCDTAVTVFDADAGASYAVHRSNNGQSVKAVRTGARCHTFPTMIKLFHNGYFVFAGARSLELATAAVKAMARALGGTDADVAVEHKPESSLVTMHMVIDGVAAGLSLTHLADSLAHPWRECMMPGAAKKLMFRGPSGPLSAVMFPRGTIIVCSRSVEAVQRRFANEVLPAVARNCRRMLRRIADSMMDAARRELTTAIIVARRHGVHDQVGIAVFRDVLMRGLGSRPLAAVDAAVKAVPTTWGAETP